MIGDRQIVPVHNGNLVYSVVIVLLLLARFEHPALLLWKHHDIRVATAERPRPEAIRGGAGRSYQYGGDR